MLLSFDNVTFSYNGEPVLSNVSFTLNEKERVGLLGGNGEGKTTLLRVLVGELVPEQGTVTRGKFRIGYLEQSGGFSAEGTVYEAMKEVFAEDERLLSELARVQTAMAEADGQELIRLSSRSDSLQKRVAARDSYHVDVRIKTVLGGMGFGDRMEQTVSTMSGGEKTKLKLCRLLLEEPDLLVLDEPTNHLDVKTLFWLEDFLSSYKGALLVVSHDRYFLDRTTVRTLELENGNLTSYKGNYTKYRQLKAEKELSKTREYERQQEEIKKLQTYVDKNLVRATTAKSALSRVNRLERMDIIEKPRTSPPPPRFRFSYDTPPYERVLFAPDFDLTAGGKVLLSHVNFELKRGERCAIVGDNGTGKSTLLRFLLSRDPHVLIGRNVRLGYYDQENAGLDPEERALDVFRSQNVLSSMTDARKLLAQAGIEENDVERKVKELSGGLKAKLALALLEARRANVLVLDEPTNHLDLPARESLEQSLLAFDGTLLFVSHDRRFIETLATRIVSFEDGKLLSFEGNYTAFTEMKRSLPPPEKREEKRAENPAHRSRAERAKEVQTKSKIREIESKISSLEEKIASLDLRLSEVAADYKEVQKVLLEREETQNEIDKLYEEYEVLIG